jgi:hypothetical protein
MYRGEDVAEVNSDHEPTYQNFLDNHWKLEPKKGSKAAEEAAKAEAVDEVQALIAETTSAQAVPLLVDAPVVPEAPEPAEDHAEKPAAKTRKSR